MACRPAAIRYDAAFGRPLDYYTGLVFEIAAGDAAPAAGRRRPLRPAADAARRARRRSPASASRSGSTASRRCGRRRMTITLAIPSKGRLQGAGAGRARPRRACRQPARRRAQIPRPHRGPRRHRGGVPVGLRDRRRARPGQRSTSASPARICCARTSPTGRRRPRSPPGSASAMPMWWSRCRTSGSTSTPWPISTTSPPISASAMAGGCASPPNTGG